jgi:hypothetical protein
LEIQTGVAQQANGFVHIVFIIVRARYVQLLQMHAKQIHWRFSGQGGKNDKHASRAQSLDAQLHRLSGGYAQYRAIHALPFRQVKNPLFKVRLAVDVYGLDKRPGSLLQTVVVKTGLDYLLRALQGAKP